MTIDNLMIDDGDAIYYTEDFRHVLEDHMPFLRDHPSTKYVAITPVYSDVNHQDFYGLLDAMNVPKYLHWITMRMNNYTSPQQFTAGTLSIIAPDASVIQLIKAAHTAGNRIR